MPIVNNMVLNKEELDTRLDLKLSALMTEKEGGAGANFWKRGYVHYLDRDDRFRGACVCSNAPNCVR